jgi:radical SAM protein with 4Fe4S-binding SPASM domain
VNAFERVLHNIDLLTAAGILVNIRLNIDMYNIGEMADLVELLHQRFGTNEHLSVHCIQLYGEHSPEDNAELFARRMQLEQQLMQYGFRGQWGVRRDIKVNCCSADNDGSVVIAPDGHLGKCEHYIDSEFFGHIDSKERDEAVLRKFKERRADIEACATCFYYPQCNRNRLVMCKKYNCTPEYRQERLHETTEGMKSEYERYKML